MGNDAHRERPAVPPLSRGFVALLFVIMVSRLPFLWTGYGADADAWKVARAADSFWHTGEYEVSRLPGNPLHEILLAPCVALGGAALSNAATLCASLVLLLVFYRIANRNARYPLLLVSCLAFTPLFWINSAVTIDYVWSLLFLLLALKSALQSKPIQAGIWLGLAAGFRPSNLVALLPLLTLLYLRKNSAKQYLAFFLAALFTAGLAFMPVLAKYGFLGWIESTRAEMSDIHFTTSERFLFFGYRAVYAFGPLAAVACGAIFVRRRHELGRLLRSRDPLLISSLVSVFTFLSLFLGIPLERAYLLPALPFLLILMDRLASRNEMIVLGLCLCSLAFLNIDVIQHRGVVGTPGVNLHGGMVIEEWHKRLQLLEDRRKIAGIPLPGKAVLMTGGDEAFWFQNQYVERDTSREWKGLKEEATHKRSNPDHHFVATLSRDEIRAIQSLGYTVFCLETARNYVERVTGLSMEDEGVLTIAD